MLGVSLKFILLGKILIWILNKGIQTPMQKKNTIDNKVKSKKPRVLLSVFFVCLCHESLEELFCIVGSTGLALRQAQ
jgi:hypothetical protein